MALLRNPAFLKFHMWTRCESSVLKSRSQVLSSTVPAKKDDEVEDENAMSSKLQADLHKVLRNQRYKPPDDFDLFVKHLNRSFSVHKSKSEDRTRKAYKAQFNTKSVSHPSSVEDYFWVAPEAVKEFPALFSLPGIYASLAKGRLTALVVLTAIGGYAMAPGPFDLSALLLLTAGTTLQSAAANATNQTMEVKYDAQMYRTRNRVLVQGIISREHAMVFTGSALMVGSGILYWGINPLTSMLGVLNYFLYTAVYTPMKRTSITNTWVGALVGVIPPMMGWAAATSCVELGSLWIGSLLYIWQFPHFKALSWNIKNDYQRAGYQMSAVTHPELCKRVAFRHTIIMTAACCLGPLVGVTTNMFVLYSLPMNLYGTYLAWRFYQDGDSKSSRNLFRFSLVQLPYLFMFMLISKNWFYDEKTDRQDIKVA